MPDIDARPALWSWSAADARHLSGRANRRADRDVLARRRVALSIQGRISRSWPSRWSPAGCLPVLVGYDLHPEVTLRRMMEEACEGHCLDGPQCRAVRRRSRPPGGLRSFGRCATLRHGAVPTTSPRHGLPRSPVRGALLISGSYDMEPHSRHERYLDMGLADGELVRDASPACNPPLDPDGAARHRGGRRRDARLYRAGGIRSAASACRAATTHAFCSVPATTTFR